MDMITAFLAGALLLAAEERSQADATANGQRENVPPQRLIAEIEREMTTALREEATAKAKSQHGSAVQRLCEIHASIVADPRFATSDTLKTYRAKLWSRLTKIKQDLRRDVAKEIGKPAVDPAQEQALRLSAASMADALSLADSAGGAPTGLLARGGAAQIDANAQTLIELIERTIDPDFWDVNGGPGTIFYYPNLQCLVVRATGEVHGKIGGVLGGVRDAGR
jgi:hypothetical protein